MCALVLMMLYNGIVLSCLFACLFIFLFVCLFVCLVLLLLLLLLMLLLLLLLLLYCFLIRSNKNRNKHGVHSFNAVVDDVFVAFYYKE